MLNPLFKSVVFMVAGLWIGHAHAQQSQTGSLAEVEVDRGADGRAWAVIPGAFYSQETSVGFALFGSSTFPLKNAGAETWPSTIASAVVYTLENQVSFTAWPSLYFGGNNSWVVEGMAFAEHYPTRFYALGGDSGDSYELYTRRSASEEMVLLRRVVGDWFVGLSHNLRFTGIEDIGEVQTEGQDGASSDRLASGDVAGSDGSAVHGAGVAVRLDGRDNDQSTRSGNYLEIRGTGYPQVFGGNHGFGELVVDSRSFRTVGPDVTLGAQWLTELRRGDVPFTSMSMLGGDEVLRGMYQGRYRDRSMTVLQGDLRFPVVRRFRGIASASSGQVFETLDQVDGDIKWTLGGGLRYELDAQTHSVVRLDTGFGPDGSGFLLHFGEAF